MAGILQLSYNNYFKRNGKSKVVCTVTGHGLKDPNIAIENVDKPVTVKADIKEILKAGAKGFVLKNVGPEELVKAFETIT